VQFPLSSSVKNLCGENDNRDGNVPQEIEDFRRSAEVIRPKPVVISAFGIISFRGTRTSIIVI
jgi:hypothetical protein